MALAVPTIKNVWMFAPKTNPPTQTQVLVAKMRFQNYVGCNLATSAPKSGLMPKTSALPIRVFPPNKDVRDLLVEHFPISMAQHRDAGMQQA